MAKSFRMPGGGQTVVHMGTDAEADALLEEPTVMPAGAEASAPETKVSKIGRAAPVKRSEKPAAVQARTQ